jgi:hypothetical protein
MDLVVQQMEQQYRVLQHLDFVIVGLLDLSDLLDRHMYGHVVGQMDDPL